MMCYNGLKSHHSTINIHLLSPKTEVLYFQSNGFLTLSFKNKTKQKTCFKEAPYEYLKLAYAAEILLLTHSHMESTYLFSVQQLFND